MAVSIAGVFLASARPGELAYRHTSMAKFDKTRAELSTDGSCDRSKDQWEFEEPGTEELYGQTKAE